MSNGRMPADMQMATYPVKVWEGKKAATMLTMANVDFNESGLHIQLSIPRDELPDTLKEFFVDTITLHPGEDETEEKVYAK